MVAASDSPSIVCRPVAGIAGYRLRPVEFRAGDTRLDVLVVEDLQEHVDAAELLRNDDAPEPPYWAHLWPGSRVLARLLEDEPVLGGRTVVDLGCGVGLAAVAAARRGACVIAVDTAADALRVARLNAQRNRCRIEVLQTDVRQPGLRGPFDLCVAADVTYDPSLQTAIAEFLRCHLSPGGQAWCAESVRNRDGGFATECRARGLSIQESEETEVDEGRPVPVRVTRIRRASTRG